jgi:polyhydroxyalkanoate synthase
MKDNAPKEEAVKVPDPVEFTRAMIRIGEQSQKLMRDFMERQKDSFSPKTLAETGHIAAAFMNMSQHMMQTMFQQPDRFVQTGVNLWQDYMKLWSSTAHRMMGAETPAQPVITPASNDRRFQDAAWNQNAVFDYIKQSYLLSARWMQGMLQETQGVDEKTARKVDFYTRQFVDAISPSNFLLTNPEVLRRTMETGGDNLVKGLENLLADMERGKGALKIAMTDERAFDIGRNIANTPGKVIFQNELMQLIQYEPMTETVHEVPLLIIPPWINKFYILDLGEKKSFVRFLLEQCFTVFMISWVNPDESLSEKSFEHYMAEGPMAALTEIKAATGAKAVNITGYCLGGTLLACMLAYLAANEKDRARLPAINAATFLVTLLDFSDAGEISVFIDEEQLDHLENKMEAQGFLDAQSMATTFNLLRANDLIWSFVVNNYLMGKEPFPFDLLYWNSDSTRMPAAMHSFYLREMYQSNRLVKQGAIKLKKIPIDLSTITTPAFFLSTREDHIAPWRSTYAGPHLLKGPSRFVLSASGHIAGVVNPPQAKKYHYWTNEALPPTSDAWLNGAEKHDGSWWPEWEKWLRGYSGKKVPARSLEEESVTLIENAPGSYVRVKAG